MVGGGGGGVALSPSGSFVMLGLCSDDSAGGASLPRAGGFCWELLPSRFAPDDCAGDGAGAGGLAAAAAAGFAGVEGPAAGGTALAAAAGGGGALAISTGGRGAGDGGDETVPE